MARFKPVNYGQVTLLPVSFAHQILPGSFEYTLNYLVDNELDLSVFDARYHNDDTGRLAYDPAVLLKIVVLAYSKGITSSRKMEALCRDNVLFMAISADAKPHFTTLADFVSSNHEAIAKLFSQVLMVCGQCGLIGNEMFAIDGCKLPSNASKEWSGTHDELRKKQQKLDTAVKYILGKHRDNDKHERDAAIEQREVKQVETLQKASHKIKEFLAREAEKIGHKGKAIKSNITDNESAKMKTSHGVIQGYTGVASVDSLHQVVLAAEAFGQGQEHGLLPPMIEQTQQALKQIGREASAIQATAITADSGYHSEATLQFIAEHELNAYIADKQFRRRDPRFNEVDRFRPFKKANKFTLKDFQFNPNDNSCVCPAGNPMWLNSEKAMIKGQPFLRFRAFEKDCPACPLRERCLQSSAQHTPRQINIPHHRLKPTAPRLIDAMRDKIDSALGRHVYSHRISVVEPVFGHINTMMNFKRFSLRGKQKVNAQWQLITLVHNLLKIHRFGGDKRCR